MRIQATIQQSIVWLAAVGLLIPQVGLSAGRDGQTPIRDLALQPGATLQGVLLTVEGQPAANQSVVLLSHHEPVARVSTGADGRFAFTGVRPGLHALATDQVQLAVRVWSPSAAPPSAVSEVLVVTEQGPVVRGAFGGFWPKWQHPLLVGGLLITAGVIGGVIGYNIRDFDPAS